MMTESAVFAAPANERVQKIRALFQDEREQAMQNAKETVRLSYGSAPKPDQFNRAVPSKYPAVFSIIVFALCAVVLIAAFATSAMRLYHIGRSTFMEGLPHEASADIAGASTVVLAEATQMIATLALVLVAAQSMRVALYATAGLATAIAIIGNVAVARPGDPFANPITWTLAFAWLEAVAPPLIVLAVMHVLKHQVLDAINRLHEAKRQYEIALDGWQAKLESDPLAHARWNEFYMNSLQDAIRRANHTVQRATWNALTRPDWIYLLRRELSSSALHEDVRAAIDVQPIEVQPPPVIEGAKAKQLPSHIMRPVAKSNGGGGRHTGAVDEAAKSAVVSDGMITITCPQCAMQLQRDSELGAKRALNAHMKKHRNEERESADRD